MGNTIKKKRTQPKVPRPEKRGGIRRLRRVNGRELIDLIVEDAQDLDEVREDFIECSRYQA